MKKYFNTRKPMFVTVSHNRSVFIIHYAKSCNVASCKSGYSEDALKDFDGPVVRFDKAELDDVLESVKGPAIPIVGIDNILPSEKSVTLEEYFSKLRSHNIPIEMGYRR